MSIHTKIEFDQMIEKIHNLVEKYENNVLHNNQYQFYLANGERISFEITPQSIAHLLGIRLDYLRGTKLFKNQDSYSLLKEFLDNAYFVYRQIQEGHLTYSTMFSEHLEEKLKSFEKIIYYFSPNDIDFICKYDKSKIYQSGDEKDYPCDYFVAKKSNNGDIYLLGLIQKGNQYNPMTNITFVKDASQVLHLKHLLANQTLTYVNSILVENHITNYRNNSHMTISLKLEQMKKLKKYAGYASGVAIDTSAEFQYALNGYMLKDNKLNAYKLIFQQLSQTIKQHELFDVEQMEDSTGEPLDEEMIQMIGTYNNAICQGENTSAQITYTNLLEQYRALALQVNNLNEQLKQVQEESMKYQMQVQELQAQNEQYQAFQEQIFTAVEKQKQKVIVE